MIFINQHYVYLVKCESATRSWANDKYLNTYKVKDQTHSVLKKSLTRTGKNQKGTWWEEGHSEQLK